MDPKGKVALVTGGASGIGLAICKHLLQEDVKGVAVCDVNATTGLQVTQELGSEFGQDRVVFIKCDVTKQEDMEDAFKKTQETFQQLDIVVNNAGILNDRNWELEVDVNVKGVIRGILLSYEYMGKNKGGNGGVVINMGSVAAFTAGIGIPIYSGLKSAVVGLTSAFGDPYYLRDTDVRVMAVCPGVTQSGLLATKKESLLQSEWEPLVKSWFTDENMQPTECVSRTVIHMIKHGRHGSLWISVKDLPQQEVALPHFTQMFINKE